ncbi:hypothetical protein [Allorhodopirellula heiligendammensis]|uniref:FlgN protein n=1 Tax=Allorhodopirellula heiligendammensis TaxID=2714739 RepID=A0A5C6C4C6_9BACT|nr:hypothetical protein [Allorhodopirellula heiligendammensis]TWU19393.1 hypothetical protein Poly21_15660 [Allorhodopirellula heiligendammensis]
MTELEPMIENRHELLAELLELTKRQELVIASGHMNELMRLLSDKQLCVERLLAVTRKLERNVASHHPPPEVSDRHRRLHRECDAMHRELISRELVCEKNLAQLRGTLNSDEKGRQSISGYSRPSPPPSLRGDHLDLSSEA